MFERACIVRFATVRGAFLLAICSLADPARAQGPEVLVVAEQMQNVPAPFQPAAGKKVPCLFLGSTERDLGGPVAGEPELDPVKLQGAISGLLARRGYALAKLGSAKPLLAIIVTWGSARLVYDEFPSDDGGSSTTTFFNKREIARLIGAEQAHGNFRSESTAAAVNEAGNRNRLYVALAAFDADALARHEKKLIWRVFLSIESRGQTLPAALPAMLQSALPFLGRDTHGPTLVNDADRLHAHVELGDLIVMPDEPSTK